MMFAVVGGDDPSDSYQGLLFLRGGDTEAPPDVTQMFHEVHRDLFTLTRMISKQSSRSSQSHQPNFSHWSQQYHEDATMGASASG